MANYKGIFKPLSYLSKKSAPTFDAKRWDETIKVNVNPISQEKRVVFTTPNYTARIVINYDVFLSEYEKKYSRKGTNQIYITFIENVEKSMADTNELDLNMIINDLDLGHYFIIDFILELSKDGNISLFDIKNNTYVDYFTIQDKGYRSSGLNGEGNIKYILPSGEIYYEDTWIS
jgi:hypothetical protein